MTSGTGGKVRQMAAWLLALVLWSAIALALSWLLGGPR